MGIGVGPQEEQKVATYLRDDRLVELLYALLDDLDTDYMAKMKVPVTGAYSDVTLKLLRANGAIEAIQQLRARIAHYAAKGASQKLIDQT